MSTSNRSKTTFPKPRKLRASCDGCNEAKVRCSQTKPACARCIKNGTHCVYGISQRVGKQSASAYAAKQRAQQESGILTPVESPPGGSSKSSSAAASPRHSRISSVPSAYHEDDVTERAQQELFRRWTFDGRSNYGSTSPGTEISSLDLQEASLLDQESLQMWRQASMDGLITPLETDMIIDSHPYMPDTMTNHLLAGAVDPLALSGGVEYAMAPSGTLPSSINPNALASVPGLPLPRSSKSASECRCTESIVTKLASLPVLLGAEDCAFDIKLVQFQEAIKVSNAALACKCICKDYSSMLALSLLISRLLSVVQFAWTSPMRDRQNGPPSDMNDLSPMTPEAPVALPATAAPHQLHLHHRHHRSNMEHAPVAHHMHPAPPSHLHHAHQMQAQYQFQHPQQPPTFSLGIFQVDKEDEMTLKREVWLLQLRKVKNLVTSFRGLVAEAKRDTDQSQSELLEQLVVTLEDRACKVDEA